MIFYDIVPPEKLKKFAKEEILGIKAYKTQKEKYFAFGWRMTLVLAIISVSIFLSLSRGSLEAQEQIKIIPTSFSGDWQNPEAVFSQDLTQEAIFEEFNQGNSAHPLKALDLLSEEVFLSEEAVSLEEETKFTPEVPSDEPIPEEAEETEEQNLEGEEENEAEAPEEQEDSMEQEQQEESVEQEEAEEQEEPESEPTSFWNKIRDFLWGTVQAQEENQDQAHGDEEEFPEENFPEEELPADGEILEEGLVLEEEMAPIERTLELYNFSVSEDFSKKEIRNVQLRLSLAAKGTPNDYLIIEYYYKENWQSLASFNLESEISNNLNGGYFLYALPIFENWQELEDLKIRFRYLQQGADGQGVYLDAVWLEVEYGELEEVEGELTAEEIEKLPRIEIKKEKAFKLLRKDFRADEEPEFEIDITSLEVEYLSLNQFEIPATFEGAITPTLPEEILPEETLLEETSPEETPPEETLSEETPLEESSLEETPSEGISSEESSSEETSPAEREEALPETEPEDTPTKEKENSNPSSLLDTFQKLISVEEVFAQTPEIKILKTEVFNPVGKKIEVLPEIQEIGETIGIRVPKPSGDFRPGKYAIIVEILIGEKVFVSREEFTWGVLAINTNKSIYLPNETAYLQMAVLNSAGHTICDATLSLIITAPDGETAGPSIQKSGECRMDNVTDVPDYFTYYQVGGPGIYQMELTSLDNGYKITDSFEVRESVPFDVERIGPTRIYPAATYEMTLKIKTNQDFQGEVVEQVPVSFVIIETSDKRQETKSEEKNIIWDVDWKAGETYELKYQFDAPDVSPFIYLLGPLAIQGETSGGGLVGKIKEILDINQISFQEMRQWQIAADADYDETYTFDDQTSGEVGWDYDGPDVDNLQTRDTDGAWCWTSTGSPSGSTGPPSGVACVYTETSSPVAVNDEFFMTLTDAVDASTYGLYVTLDRCTYGNTSAHLYFEAWNGTGWDAIDDWAGDSVTTFTSEGPYDFTTYDNSDFKIRFRTVVAGTTYTNDMAVDTVRIYGDLKVEVPDAPTLYSDDGGTTQIVFSNIRQNSTTPTFRASTTHTADFNRFQLELNDAADFSGTAHTQTFSGTFNSGTQYNLAASSLSPSLPTTDGVTYYVRVRASADGGTNYGAWSTDNSCCEVWSFTYKSASEDPDWFQTTDEQFETGDLDGTETSGSDSVQLGGGGTIEKAGTDAKGSSDATPLQFNHTLVAGSNRLVVILIGWENEGSITVTGVTYGGETCTEVTQSDSGGTGYVDGTAIYYISEANLPDDGENQVSITFSASSTSDFKAYVAQYTGVLAGGPDSYDTSAESSPGDSTIENTSLTAEAGDLCVSAADAGNKGSWGHGQSQNELWDFEDASSQFAATDLITTGSITQLESTFTGTLNRLARSVACWSPVPVTSGTIMSPEIDYDWLMGAVSWYQFDWSEDETSGTVKAQLWYDTTPTTCDACNAVIPNTDLPNNENWFTSGSQTISDLDTDDYNCICIKAQLDKVSDTPYLLDWTVSWSSEAGNHTPSVDSVSISPTPTIDLNADTTKTVTITATITDNDGCEDVFTNGSITGVFFDDAAEDDTCSQDDNDCYANLTLTEVDDTCSGAGDYTADASVNVDVWFIANPSSSWTAKVTAIDEASASDSDTQTVTVNTLIAFKLDTSSIAYSTVNPNEVSSQQTVLITTTGNAAIDVEFSGTSMTWSGNEILVGQQKYSASSGFDWDTQGTALTGTPACHELSTGKPTAHPSNQSENVYWKLKVPTGKAAGGPYSGSNTFDVVSDSACP